jgi:hypothetical protein
MACHTCDIDDLLAQIACLECEIPPGLVGYVILAQLLRISGQSIDQILAQIGPLQAVPAGFVGTAILAQTVALGPAPEPVGDFRITENANIRATETGDLRIWH